MISNGGCKVSGVGRFPNCTLKSPAELAVVIAPTPDWSCSSTWAPLVVGNRVALAATRALGSPFQGRGGWSSNWPTLIQSNMMVIEPVLLGQPPGGPPLRTRTV